MQSRSVATIDHTMDNIVWPKHSVYKYHYAITISCHSKTKEISKQDLEFTIIDLKWRLPDLYFTNYVFETSGKYKQLHLHGTCHTKHKVLYMNNNSLNGFRVHWKPIYNIKGWNKYLLKDQKPAGAIRQ